MSKTKLSVIIPVFGVQRGLDQTLESILSQSLQELEVICVSNADPDGHPAQSWKEKDGRVSLLRYPGKTEGALAREGMKCAEGDFLHFMIPGDTVPEYAYECAVAKAERYEVDCLKCAGAAWDDQLDSAVDLPGYTLSEMRPGDFHRLLSLKEKDSPLLSITHAPWTGIYRRSALEAGRILYPEAEGCAGTLFYQRVISGGRRVMLSRDTLVIHHLKALEGDMETFRTEMEARARAFYLLDEGLEADGEDEETAGILFRNSAGRMMNRFQRWRPLLWKEDDLQPAEEMAEILKRCGQIYQGRFYYPLQDQLGRMIRLTANRPAPKAAPEQMAYHHKRCKHPKVSVVVPIYNVQDYLNEALYSLSTQTLEEMEFLCVNDGSTDKSLAIVKQYAARDQRVVILDGPNGGYGKAMNRGIDAAKGEYLGILEPDDFVLPDMFRRLYKLAVRRDVDFVKADFYRFLVNPDGSLRQSRNRLSRDESYYGRLVNPSQELETFKFIMNTWSGIYKLSFLNRYHIRHNETPGASYQDNGFWFQTFCRATRAWFVKRPYYMNRRDNPNSSMFARNKMYCITEEYKYIWDWMSKEPELVEHFAPIYYVKKLGNFMVTLQRISEELRPEYLHHMRDEFLPLVEQHKLREDMLGTIDWIKLNEILADPDGYAQRIRVSVIIPVYNAQEHLRQCLDSIMIRREMPIEVICVDDGSTDGSLDILREYEQKYPRFKVITQENAGAGAARNNGLQYATGEYLSFLDADDFFEPEMLRRAYDKAHCERADIVAFRSNQYISTTGEFLSARYTISKPLLPFQQPFAGQDIPRDAFKLFVGWAWDKLFRTDFVRQTGVLFQQQRTSNDMLFVFSHVVKAQRIVTMDNVFAHHRREEGSLSVTREKSWACFYHALVALRQQLKDWDLYDRFERDFINYSQHFTLWNLTSLRGASFFALYEQLNNGWLQDLGILDHDSTYFYNQYEFEKLRTVTTLSAEDFMAGQLDEARTTRDELRRELNEATDELRRLEQQNESLLQSKEKLEQRRDQLTQEKKKLNQQLRKMRGSMSWKLGRILTWLPRRLKKLIKRTAK